MTVAVRIIRLYMVVVLAFRDMCRTGFSAVGSPTLRSMNSALPTVSASSL